MEALTVQQQALICFLLVAVFVAGFMLAKLRESHYRENEYLRGMNDHQRIMGPQIIDMQEKLRIARRSCIQLNDAEMQSGYTRVQWAEGLIKQLPETHEGRNSWLLNYGSGKVGQLRKNTSDGTH